MKYKFKIFGAPLDRCIIEIDVDPNDTIGDVKQKILDKIDFPINPKELKIDVQE